MENKESLHHKSDEKYMTILNRLDTTDESGNYKQYKLYKYRWLV